MSLTMTPQHVSSDTTPNNQTHKPQRARLLLSDITIFNFTGSLAAQASRRHSMKSAIMQTTPTSAVTAMRSPRPKLQRRHGSDQLSFERQATDDKDQVEHSAVPPSIKITSLASIFGDDLDCKDLDAGILASPPAHDKPISTTIRSPPAQTSPINVTVCAIDSDSDDDDSANTISTQASSDEGGVSYVEYAEVHEYGASHPINASPSADYATPRAGLLEHTENSYTPPPTFITRRIHRSSSHDACEHSYHTLDCISETSSPLTSPTISMWPQHSSASSFNTSTPMASPLSANSAFVHFPAFPDTKTMPAPPGLLMTEGDVENMMSVPKLVLTPPEEEVADVASKNTEVMCDGYNEKGHYVRAPRLGHGR